MASIGQGLKSLFLWEFVTAFGLAMRYFFAKKKTLDYPFERGPSLASISRRARPQALSKW